jgi:hypothetical protein
MNDPFLAGCINQMTAGFDAMMGFPQGTAMQMGMFDGIAGLQGFTIRETVDGSTHGCNPFGGPSNSPVSTAFGVNVNNCMPNAANDPYGGMLQGTCSGPAASPWPASCVGGFRNGQGCAPNPMNPAGGDADCIGNLASPMPLLYGRNEVRTHFKIALQQSTGGAAYSVAASRVTFPMTSIEKNPSNAAHNVTWDQAQRCFNPMSGADVPCSDGGYIKTTVSANDFLGYDTTKLNNLMDPATASIARPNSGFVAQTDSAVDYQMNFQSVACATCTYSWTLGDGGTASSSSFSHTYANNTPRSVALTVVDAATGLSSSTTQTVTPRYVAANPTAVSITGSSVLGNTATINFTVSGGVGPYKVKTTWSDGSVTTASGVASGASSTSHTYTNTGTYTVTITATDTGVSGLVTSSSKTTSVMITPGTGTITGLVTRVGGTVPVASASVTLKQNGVAKKLAYTNASGTYTMTGISAGTYTLTAAKSGLTFTTSPTVVSTGSGTVTAPTISSTN